MKANWEWIKVDFRGDPEYRVKTPNRKMVLKMGTRV